MTSNKRFVTLFLLGVIGFTGIMTFVVGPRMMAVRDQVAQDRFYHKCQKILSGDSLEVQARGWERPNPHPVVRVRLAALEAPPTGDPGDPEVTAWAERHGLDPEVAARMGHASERNLTAYIRKQNLVLKTADGAPVPEHPPEDLPVHVFVSGTHLNRKLLESGLAVAAPRKDDAYAETCLQAQASAKSAKRGLWQ